MALTEVEGDYEAETGSVILEAFENKPPLSIPAVLVACHGPFTWGRDARNAAETAAVLEEVAFMAWHTEACASIPVPVPQALEPIQQALLDRHYLRKHGVDAYYGQGDMR
jgi:L-ribulose-5-phosphate 4-epimerase